MLPGSEERRGWRIIAFWVQSICSGWWNILETESKLINDNCHLGSEIFFWFCLMPQNTHIHNYRSNTLTIFIAPSGFLWRQSTLQDVPEAGKGLILSAWGAYRVQGQEKNTLITRCPRLSPGKMASELFPDGSGCPGEEGQGLMRLTQRWHLSVTPYVPSYSTFHSIEVK